MAMTKRKPRIITVAMTKGGQTKTTQALGLATLIVMAGQPVKVFDTDVTNTNMSKFLRRRVQACKGKSTEQIANIPFIQVNTHTELEREVQEAYYQGFNCVIDCAPTTDSATISAMLLADVILIPVRQGAVEADALERLDPILQAVVTSARKSGVTPPEIFTLLADYRKSLTAKEIQAQIERLLYAKFLGCVPHSEVIGRCIREGFAFWERYPTRLRAMEYRDLLALVLGKGFLA